MTDVAECPTCGRSSRSDRATRRPMEGLIATAPSQARHEQRVLASPVSKTSN